MVTIRRLTEEDAPLYHALRVEALRRCPEAFLRTAEEEERRTPDEVRTFLRERTGSDFILGAFVDDQLVGMVGFYQQALEKIRHRGCVWGMYVKPEHQGKGIGRQLMERLAAEARANPEIEQITLTVMSENQAAVRLYEQAGFRRYGTAPRSMRVGGRYLDEDLMVLFLRGPQPEPKKEV